MRKLFSNKTALFLLIAFLVIVAGIILLINSPIGIAFAEGFQDGYNQGRNGG